MAHSTPHLEDGYLKIAHGIYQVLAQGILSCREMRVVLFLLGKTYAWGKKEDWVSVSQFVDGTGIERRNMRHLLKEMVAKNILKKGGDVLYPTYGFNKYHKTWKVGGVDLTRGQFNPGGGVVLTPGGGVVLTPTARGQNNPPQKKYKKTIQKKTLSLRSRSSPDPFQAGLGLGAEGSAAGGGGAADLQTKNRAMKKNTFGSYREDGADFEDAIDLETGEAVMEVATVKTPNFAREILRAFEVVDPKNKTYLRNKTQLAACVFLAKEYGLDAVLKRIEMVRQTNVSADFFHKVYSPHDLMKKWVAWEDEARKVQGKITKDKDIIAFV